MALSQRLTRLAMGVVVLMTTTLLIVRCGELLDGNFGIPANSFTTYSKRGRDFIRFFLVAFRYWFLNLFKFSLLSDTLVLVCQDWCHLLCRLTAIASDD